MPVDARSAVPAPRRQLPGGIHPVQARDLLEVSVPRLRRSSEILERRRSLT
jgi:hypothetical protein